jgi:hypothetical protein
MGHNKGVCSGNVMRKECDAETQPQYGYETSHIFRNKFDILTVKALYIYVLNDLNQIWSAALHKIVIFVMLFKLHQRVYVVFLCLETEAKILP